MHVNVLGPLEATMHGCSIVPSAAKPRQVLAMLAMRAGQLVTTSTLVEELWGVRAPRTAEGTVQTYVLRLRQQVRATLPPGAADVAKKVLVTRPRGYVLNIPPEYVDVHRYQTLVAAGERALAAGHDAAASRLLGQALDVWRGAALADVESRQWLAVEVSRLEQGRLSVLEDRIGADLRLGRQQQLLGELAELTTRYPMHEKLCTHYMSALSSCGQKWRALEAFWTLRTTLVEELGIEPSLEVQRLQQELLSAEGEADQTRANRRAIA